MALFTFHRMEVADSNVEGTSGSMGPTVFPTKALDFIGDSVLFGPRTCLPLLILFLSGTPSCKIEETALL